ncbi:hypothetical protein HT136_22275 [Novosphingobium profundi]|uniref:hypothetical protein n=1 Tax=Novosphingobium profundi TaxID=1774954 RepID=UPI001BDA8862|nr:hypothetical protein [Novosphingobium profundi]MBT0671103.1 hypothetical protein [Novosphingobium profundi]
MITASSTTLAAYCALLFATGALDSAIIANPTWQNETISRSQRNKLLAGITKYGCDRSKVVHIEAKRPLENSDLAKLFPDVGASFLIIGLPDTPITGC